MSVKRKTDLKLLDWIPTMKPLRACKGTKSCSIQGGNYLAIGSEMHMKGVNAGKVPAGRRPTVAQRRSPAGKTTDSKATNHNKPPKTKQKARISTGGKESRKPLADDARPRVR